MSTDTRPSEGAQELVYKWRTLAEFFETATDSHQRDGAKLLRSCADELEAKLGGAAAPLPFAAPPLECACGGANDHCDGTCSYESAPLAAEAGLMRRYEQLQARVGGYPIEDWANDALGWMADAAAALRGRGAATRGSEEPR
jgi:hypothetical protein